MEYIDLRSDTVTQPTPSMRAAMANAPVGDDVYGEDPTINRLQEMAAKRMGKEAGLFVASGTMGNLIAILTHCGRGDEAIMGDQGHTFVYEAGGISALGGVMPHTVPNQSDGTLKVEDLQEAIRPDDIHQPVSRLIVLENTQNRCGGIPLTAEYTRQVRDLAHTHGLRLHIDGARIFNAAAALHVDTEELAAPADSITFCLSKGLCAPVGSVLCGTNEFIYGARKIRKQLGGGMRQAGILAAAGIVALNEMTERLGEDHERARMIAQNLGAIPGINLSVPVPQSNMVFITIDESIKLSIKQVVDRLAGEGVLVSQMGSSRIRLVTHYWITDEAANKALLAFKKVLK